MQDSVGWAKDASARERPCPPTMICDDGWWAREMNRDKLFLLRPDFADPAYPGRRFYCWHCALMEGVLASFPALAKRLDVERIAWPRPRLPVVEMVGEENQSVPLLVLADGDTSPHQTGTYDGRAFISDKDKILAALSERHGFPDPHP